ncbi:MAG: outer membrane lipoprotein carrier protein LolA [Ignavibacteriales bacterium]|nr:outer membrane lipoprotein carrier protein LolA [Ignavibacteriales bacterium]
MKKFLFLISLFCIQILIAQDANQRLKQMQDKFKSIEHFKAEFTQNPGQGNKEFTGTFYFAKGNKFRVEMPKKKIVSDGTNIWNYDEDMKRVVINLLEDDASAFTLEKYILEYPSDCSVELVNGNSNTIKLTANDEDELGFFYSILWLDSNLMVNKIEIKDLNNSIFTLKLKNINTESSISNTKFTFQAPSGTKVVDLR